MKISKSIRPLPSVAQVIAFVIFMIVAIVMGVAVPHSWSLGLLAGLPFGFWTVAQANAAWSRHRKWYVFDLLSSRSRPAHRQLARDIQAGAIPPRAEKVVVFASSTLMAMIVVGASLLLFPAIFDRDMPGYEVTMRAFFAGPCSVVAVFMYPSRPGRETSGARSRVLWLALFIVALAIYAAWDATH